MQPHIGIKPENLKEVAQSLSALLADEFLLYVKTRNAHWNVEGANFYSMHRFFESLYEQIDEIMDDVAERIRALGHYTPATLKTFLALTHLSDQVPAKNDTGGFIKELLIDHETIVMRLRGEVNRFAGELNDSGSSDYITGLMEQHEKMAWMLRSHLAENQ